MKFLAGSATEDRWAQRTGEGMSVFVCRSSNCSVESAEALLHRYPSSIAARVAEIGARQHRTYLQGGRLR